jgi:hypothetical protein
MQTRSYTWVAVEASDPERGSKDLFDCWVEAIVAGRLATFGAGEGIKGDLESIRLEFQNSDSIHREIMVRSPQLTHAVQCMVWSMGAHGHANYLSTPSTSQSMSPTSTGHVYGNEDEWVHFLFSLAPTWCDQPPVGAFKLAPAPLHTP